MARTRRNVPADIRMHCDKDFVDRWERGLVDVPISDPDCPFSEIDGDGKRYAKKRASRKRRIANKIVIDREYNTLTNED